MLLRTIVASALTAGLALTPAPPGEINRGNASPAVAADSVTAVTADNARLLVDSVDAISTSSYTSHNCGKCISGVNLYGHDRHKLENWSPIADDIPLDGFENDFDYVHEILSMAQDGHSVERGAARSMRIEEDGEIEETGEVEELGEEEGDFHCDVSQGNETPHALCHTGWFFLEGYQMGLCSRTHDPCEYTRVTHDLVGAVDQRNLKEISALVSAHPSNISWNRDRGTIQVVGCTGTLIANIPVGRDMAKLIATYSFGRFAAH